MAEVFDSQECFILVLDSQLGIVPKRTQMFLANAGRNQFG